MPVDKLGRLQKEISLWTSRKFTTKRDLLSLTGQLQHAASVVRLGRSFLRRMIFLSTIPRELHHRVRLNRGFRSDLRWWDTFLQSWNGVSMMAVAGRSAPTASLTTDASGNWGCGAFTNEGDWFQLEWITKWTPLHITVKELLPIIISVAVWGERWRGQTITCRCDNAAVVAIIRSGSCKEDLAMNLLRNLVSISAYFNVNVTIEHLPGAQNTAADALSRNNLCLFNPRSTGQRRIQPSSHNPYCYC